MWIACCCWCGMCVFSVVGFFSVRWQHDTRVRQARNKLKRKNSILERNTTQQPSHEFDSRRMENQMDWRITEVARMQHTSNAVSNTNLHVFRHRSLNLSLQTSPEPFTRLSYFLKHKIAQWERRRNINSYFSDVGLLFWRADINIQGWLFGKYPPRNTIILGFLRDSARVCIVGPTTHRTWMIQWRGRRKDTPSHLSSQMQVDIDMGCPVLFLV